MATCGLYLIECTENGARYFGSATDVARRWRQHRYDLRHGKHSNSRLLRTWRKYGESTFVFTILAVVKVSERLSLEQSLLCAMLPESTTVNMAPTPTGGMAGRRHSAETIERLRRLATGKKMSTETRALMRRSQAWRTSRPETGAKISASLLARYAVSPHTKEQHDKWRQTMLTKKQAAS